MIKFSKNIIRSFIDLPEHTSMIIHSMGCNLRCYECFNYNRYVLYPREAVNEQYVLEQVALGGDLFDAIILSGGEFLANRLSDVLVFCDKLRKAFKGKIIVNTNGHAPYKMLTLMEEGLVDGFHTDMKLPFHLLHVERDAKLSKCILGIDIDQPFIDATLRAIELTVATDNGLSQIRSVRYPVLDDSAFEQNKAYIKELNQKYGKSTPYLVNKFYRVEEINADSN